jgi:hypothetical protein
MTDAGQVFLRLLTLKLRGSRGSRTRRWTLPSGCLERDKKLNC